MVVIVIQHKQLLLASMHKIDAYGPVGLNWVINKPI
uniref:Uncharacterized protein n=1 Tax=Arundo donax TaxID=35708 RepID=A0A0A9HF44_ARUDO